MSDGLDFLTGLERDLVAAAERRRDARRAARLARLRQRLGLRGGGLALLLFACVGVVSAGATFAVLRAAVIQPPAARDVPREQTPAAGSARVSELRAPDPVAGRPPWTLRLARGSTGLLCTTVGQLVDGRFGLIGLDGRFRAYDERIVDSCGERVAGPHASLVGARVFDADDPREVRTVVNGVGGPRLRGATLRTVTGRRAIAIGAGGTFVAALRGYPEDSAVEVDLRFAGGRVERHPLGRSPIVVPDPDGGQAWKSMTTITVGDARSCVRFATARPAGATASSPAACGLLRSMRHPRGWFFAVRRLEPGGPPPRPRDFDAGHWGDHPARTAVWGAVGDDVKAVEIVGPGLSVRPRLVYGRSFLAVLPGAVDPAALTVRLTLADGSVIDRRGSTNLIDSAARTPTPTVTQVPTR